MLDMSKKAFQETLVTKTTDETFFLEDIDYRRLESPLLPSIARKEAVLNVIMNICEAHVSFGKPDE